MRVKTLLFISIFSVLFIPQKVFAHSANVSYTVVTIDKNNMQLSFSTSYDNILRYYPEKDKKIEDINLDFFTKSFKKKFIITNNGNVCIPSLSKSQNKTDVKLIEYVFNIKCGNKLDMIHFQYNLFFDIAKFHANIAKFKTGDRYDEFLFTQDSRSFDLNGGVANFQTNIIAGIARQFNFFKLGIRHIFIGYDHILFLLGLLLVTVSLKNIFKIITSFTIAHSITLIVSALSIFVLPTRITESLIALSIVYVAVENLFILSEKKLSEKYKIFNAFGDTSKRRILTFLFGLIHGFGFSYVLKEVGLPKEGLVQSLLLFNLGIEFGQICIVLLLFPILWLLRKRKNHPAIVKVFSVIIGILGWIWFVQRAFM